ncbi:MAG: hypothetical protein KDD28_11595, partial [Phaeodactylibacter sp.]|nr:hypothetical protein [Phaeodactylibacter sp.]
LTSLFVLRTKPSVRQYRKALLAIGVAFCFVAMATAQVGIGTETPDASAILHLHSSTQGFLPPMMTTSERLAIADPADGLVVYDKTLTRLYYYNKTLTTWHAISIEPDGDSQNTLDLAYREGGAGAGRAITADAGAVSISSAGTNASLEVTNTTKRGISSITTTGDALYGEATEGDGLEISMMGTGRGINLAGATDNAADLLYSRYTGNAPGAVYSEGGRAGLFQLANAASSKPGLEARTTGTGHGILGITGSFSGTTEIIPSAGVAGFSLSGEERSGLYGHSSMLRGAWGKVTRENAWTLGPDSFYAGLYGEGTSASGVPPISGSTKIFMGVAGVAETGVGVIGLSKGFGHGVIGVTKGGGTLASQAGVWGAVQDATWSGHVSEYPFGDGTAAKGVLGVLGQAKEDVAIWGESQSKIGVIGTTGSKKGLSDISTVGKAGVVGLATQADAVAAFFRSEGASTRPAVVVHSKASAPALAVSTYGDGPGLEIIHKDPLFMPGPNSEKGFRLLSYGMGIAAEVHVAEPTNASAAFISTHDGLGKAAVFTIENEMDNMEPVAHFINKGKGGGAIFQVIDSEGIGMSPAILAKTDAKMPAAKFEATAGASAEPAVEVATAAGRMAYLATSNATSTLSGVEIATGSKGHAMEVISSNPASTTPLPKAALKVESLGGYVAHFEQKGGSVLRSDPAVLISSDNTATGHTVLKVTTATAPLVKAAEFDGDVDVTGDFEVGGTADLGTITHFGGVSVTSALTVSGTLTVLGGCVAAACKAFQIDHPLDDSKYLRHASIESSEMINVYNGNVTTDKDGFATVYFPEWMMALNEDFRYQLTVVGKSFAQAVVWEEMDEAGSFVIRTNAPGIKVSWQVAGRRKDSWALANPLQVESDKPDDILELDKSRKPEVGNRKSEVGNRKSEATEGSPAPTKEVGIGSRNGAVPAATFWPSIESNLRPVADKPIEE